MNNRLEWDASSTFLDHPQQQRLHASFSPWQKAITTIALLILGYYVLNFFDAWPDTIRRTLYEVTIYLIPSPAIYALQSIMHRYSGAIDDTTRFRKSEFGNQRAKAEAIQRILGHTPFPTALLKARSLSGLETILPVSKELGPPGLGNWDNSCYQNSILQGFASLPAFQEYIEKSLTICDDLQVPAATHKALGHFLRQLGDASARKTTLWTPTVLKSMDSWQQQDAQEYFSRVVEAVEKEDMKCFQVLKKRSHNGLGLPTDGSPAENESAQMLEKVSLDDNSWSPVPKSHVMSKPDRKLLEILPRSSMDGMLAQALECQTCGFSEGYSLTQFNCLTLNLGLRGHSYLEDLLDEYTEPEMIDGVECTECTKAIANCKDGEDAVDDDTPSPSKRPKLKPVHRTKAKQITIGRLPKNLILHINRSIFDEYGTQRKNNSLIRFPARLDFLSRWCAPLAVNENSVQRSYELKCSVTHYGRHENGHYVALGRRDKDWWVFNDEVVTKMSQDEVLSRGNVFMLFYEAIDTSSLRDQTSPVPTSEEVDSVTELVQRPSESTGSSDSEPLTLPEPPEPIKPIPPMRTASDSIRLPDEHEVAPSAAPVAAL
ncbi:uncharacterized protein HMPREF1541_09748 [Cyphellophora europaea CBS 101466]|uniref:ubiquitinyl hydrolase 1 n=1 Tax=Cyphellophora europaea (strain CBS 101466) TaxID=1220924 RepID=W2SA39_CYPE1|nr:uncharacterized protein HMPREF1541_09748 [Cyphellophora europaea CBS 101466]ETN44873.1 hypothetical protein HMPREF1541_09748 [Cyphellophora europaea CBS 101466]